MESQPNLANRSEVASIYKCSQKILGALPKFGALKTSNLDHFFRDFRTRHHISPERNYVASTNRNAIVNLQCVP